MTADARIGTSRTFVTSRRSMIGASLVGAALLVGSLGSATANQATPSSSPAASPAASPVASWISDIAIDPALDVDDDVATVGVKDGEALEINVAAFESRPFIVLQTTNDTKAPVTFVVFSAPAETDATGFVIPAEVADLPEGITPVGSYVVEPAAVVSATFKALPEGTYILATTDGKALSFVVNPRAELEVPDVVASPEGTPAS